MFLFALSLFSYIEKYKMCQYNLGPIVLLWNFSALVWFSTLCAQEK